MNDIQALMAMEKFVRYYVETFGYEGAARMLLTDINCNITNDGMPSDSAAWSEWVRICEEMRRTG